jgi:hypothetical protein
VSMTRRMNGIIIWPPAFDLTQGAPTFIEGRVRESVTWTRDSWPAVFGQQRKAPGE